MIGNRLGIPKTPSLNLLWIRWGLLIGSLLLSATCSRPSVSRQVFVLGIDGLDPILLKTFMDQGLLPNFSRLALEGDLKSLSTTMPPLSPVAWSTFITGMDPGGHAIFDFIHRDPKTLLPEMSMSRARPSSYKLRLGSYVFPMLSGGVEQLRQGKAFWEIFDEHGIPSTIFRMPVNFPPVGGSRAFSGMGTPDILGTSGTFSFYTSKRDLTLGEIPGGRVHWVQVVGDHASATLRGPVNELREVENDSGQTENPELTIDFDIFIDAEEPFARLVIQDKDFILKEGEWSEWIRFDFEALPYLANLSAVGRFYLQKVRPELQLYLTPLQINPEEPIMPISNPEDWANKLFLKMGYFYTQELAEDTKAFSSGIFNGQEFWQQAQFVFAEQKRALGEILKEYTEGFTFFYFSGVDQTSHMLWRFMDPGHPAYQPDDELSSAIQRMYVNMDDVLGEVSSKLKDDATLIVMSDHGFAPFERQIHLNSWLLDQGYVTLKDPSMRGRSPLFHNVDWDRTQAYALGLNGLYVNLREREAGGIIPQGAPYQALLDKLEKELLAMVDPETGNNPITKITRPERDFNGPLLVNAPDIIVGYGRGYRSSWQSPLGQFPEGLIELNRDPWSGDHAMDPRSVPGVLLSNRPITLEKPTLQDLTVSVLDEYGIEKLPEMTGQDCLGSP